MNMYNYSLKARVSLRTLSSLVINLFSQVAIVLELALVAATNLPHKQHIDLTAVADISSSYVVPALGYATM
jgi:hypothetical protein